jgi:tetratricopeptide (TPR) repeat protein
MSGRNKSAMWCLPAAALLVAGWNGSARAADAPPQQPHPPASAGEVGGNEASATATAMTPEAREHFDRGSVHYNLGEYDQAIVAFRAAYRSEPRIQFLWAIAQSERLKGDCRAAIRSYESFLRSGPTQVGAGLAWSEIAGCQAQLLAAQSSGRAVGAPSSPSPS